MVYPPLTQGFQKRQNAPASFGKRVFYPGRDLSIDVVEYPTVRFQLPQLLG
jgi:hypothetical protein